LPSYKCNHTRRDAFSWGGWFICCKGVATARCSSIFLNINLYFDGVRARSGSSPSRARSRRRSATPRSTARSAALILIIYRRGAAAGPFRMIMTRRSALLGISGTPAVLFRMAARHAKRSFRARALFAPEARASSTPACSTRPYHCARLWSSSLRANLTAFVRVAALLRARELGSCEAHHPASELAQVSEGDKFKGFLQIGYCLAAPP
jgi:hypothetical protein